MAKMKNNMQNNLLQFVDPSNMEIWVNRFTERSAQMFRDQVMFRFEANPVKPIVIYIDSYGGSVDSLAKMIATMNEVPVSFITCCIGKAMSAGAILLSHGEIRFCDKDSRVMIHEISAGSLGSVNVHDNLNDAQELKRVNSHFMGLLATNCGLKNYEKLKNIIKENNGRELYLSADKAKEMGIVDYVGIPSIIENTEYGCMLVDSKVPQIRKREKTKDETDVKRAKRSPRK